VTRVCVDFAGMTMQVLFISVLSFLLLVCFWFDFLYPVSATVIYSVLSVISEALQHKH